MKAITESVCAVAFLVLAGESCAQSVTPPPGAALCASCHGAHGEGSPAGAARLAGQDVAYMRHALSMFKTGTRASPIMQPIARGLSDESISELTQFFSSQSGPTVEVATAISPQLVRAGEEVVETGPAPCFSCHGAAGLGSGTRYPSIAGQPERFIVDRLHEFQRRAHEAKPKPGTMTAVSMLLSEDQIESSAAYLSRLQR